MRSTNAYALLCLLSLQPMNGYIMKQWVDNLLKHFWKTSYGQIYPTMEQFLTEGLVTVEERESESGPASKYYHITEKGLKELKGWLAEDTLDFNYRDESLMKFYFSTLLPLDTVIEKAERAAEFQYGLLEKYTNDKKILDVKDPTRQQLMVTICNQKGIFLNEARLKWAQYCAKTLKEFKENEEKKKEKENEKE